MKRTSALILGVLCIVPPVVYSQDLPLKRIALLSSGVGFFEHSGNISSQAEITLHFDANSVNDALKSLVINDPSSNSPSVSYASENTLERTLNSLKIDLSGTPGIGEILNSLKGAELEITAPNPLRGRIIGVEYRRSGSSTPSRDYGYEQTRNYEEAWLSINTSIDASTDASTGIRLIPIKDIASFKFIDESINSDLNRALDLIMSSRDSNTKNLVVNLNGTGNRSVLMSYVIPAPVWKVSYRLDLSPAGKKGPVFQGWAIVDNDSDVDWKEVELSLVTGRPVSFIQNLYPPYHLTRPTLPLAIAGAAEARTHEGSYGGAFAESKMKTDASAQFDMLASAPSMQQARSTSASSNVAGGILETASGRSAGDQFEFTLKNKVNLNRRQSAMFPLVEGNIKAEKTLIFSGSKAAREGTINPEISAELTNTLGMKLPAGPITVYDGGTYAGDALIEFLSENDKRLISYGEDLSVTGSMSRRSTRYVTAVNVAGGVMTINRRQENSTGYIIKNASNETKKIIIEHPITMGAELVEPKTSEDSTANLYRFTRGLNPKANLTFVVKEDSPLAERIILSQLRPDSFLSYSTNQEIPANVRSVLNKALELKKKADAAAEVQSELENQKTILFSEQDRVRQNLGAVASIGGAGNQNPQTQEYLKKLSDLDKDIDNISLKIAAAIKETQAAIIEYDNYLSNIKI